MTSSEYYATPAPQVEEATVDRLDDRNVEPAVAPPAEFPSEPVTVDPCAAVEPATTDYDKHYNKDHTLQYFPGQLPTRQLRGATGADLESYAAVIRGAAPKNFLQRLWWPLSLLFDERDFLTYGEVKSYVLVKDGLCYIYVSETDPSPLYAIELDAFVAVWEDRDHPEWRSYTVSPMPNTNMSPPSFQTILLFEKKNKKKQKKSIGDRARTHAFQFTFDTAQGDPNVAQLFFELVNQTDDSKKKREQKTSGGMSEKKNEK